MTLHFVPLSDDILYSDQIEGEEIIPYHVDRPCIRSQTSSGDRELSPDSVPVVKGTDLAFPHWLGQIGGLKGT